MRNAFAHDYPTEPDLQAAMLNKAVLAADQLLAALARADAFAQRYLP
ncbi:MAG: hypothetical protein WED11_06630 [Natronospirillum sp.]